MTATTTELDAILGVAAATAVVTLAASEPLHAGEPTRDADAVDAITHGAQAVLASFAGTHTGELLVVIDPEISAALLDAEGGPIDLAVALQPVLDTIALAIGPVTLAAAQVTDARLGGHRLLAGSSSALVPLLGASGPHGAVAISLEGGSAAAAFAAEPAEPLY